MVDQTKEDYEDGLSVAPAPPSSAGSSHEHSNQEDDEIQMVRNDARQDTALVKIWRIVLTAVLFATAVTVTVVVHGLLAKEQRESFETAFDQFARVIEDSALNQQRSLRTSYRGLATYITTHVQSQREYASMSNNEELTMMGQWPNVDIKYFASNAKAILHETKTEVVNLLRVVTREQRAEWENYTASNYESMVSQGHMLENGNVDDLIPFGFQPYITRATPTGLDKDIDRDVYFPSWEFSPAPTTYGLLNVNLFAESSGNSLLDSLVALRNETLFLNVTNYGVVAQTAFSKEEHDAMHTGVSDAEHPHTFFFLPVYETIEDPNSPIVAIIGASYALDASLRGLLPSGVNGLYVVVGNSCGQSFTFLMDGPTAIYEGEGDLHDAGLQQYERFIDLDMHTHADFATSADHCVYNLRIYPSQTFRSKYETSTPIVFALSVFATFLVILGVFFVYDLFNHRRSEKFVENAARSTAIVSTMFPSNIRDRLISGSGNQDAPAKTKISNLKNYLSGNGGNTMMSQKPLADLFLDTTILFGDIAGFTAWSSVREPSQVFSFLEAIFCAFDQIAKSRRVFKVETVGDCYVAATGIPQPRKDHAVVMVRFARDILARMSTLTKEMVVSHGPDTGDLSLRIGMNSGPVTAGVLRGERARFQLFGDTINTASRIEHTSQVGRIQVSVDTANSLKACGKGAWLVKREELVEAKGKGKIQTYWIATSGNGNENASQTSSGSSIGKMVVTNNTVATHDTASTGKCHGLDERTARLVDWNVEMLLQIVRQIIARREALVKCPKHDHRRHRNDVRADKGHNIGMELFNPLDEVKEIIHLPDFNSDISQKQLSSETVIVDPMIVSQLQSLVTSIASMYRPNSFHNFEHASHVTMSVIKLLARIVAPSDLEDLDQESTNGTGAKKKSAAHGTQQEDVAATLHDHTYGITSDPLTQLACAFSAMIHDVDHVGVPNAQLVKEEVRIAQIYGNRSVAEQNSLVLSWELFMSDEFSELRDCVCPSQAETDRFRQLVVNAVLATDIVDKELKQLRNDRWDKAFSDDFEENASDATDRKATIVIEHLIQASDVAHTMQHWHVYRKWNERFFRECYKAFRDGRAQSNPADSWYKGEIGFFDFYIIPLAKKLKDCGVFGKSSDEYLNYAMTNRQEWEERGEEIVAGMIAMMENEKSH